MQLGYVTIDDASRAAVISDGAEVNELKNKTDSVDIVIRVV